LPSSIFKGGTDLIAIISTIISATAVIISALSFSRYCKKDEQNKANSLTRIETKTDDIKGDVSEIKIDIKSQEKKFLEVFERLTAVESSAKQAHHRIDKLEGKERDD